MTTFRRWRLILVMRVLRGLTHVLRRWARWLQREAALLEMER
ncbi:MAG: hypothetical protein WD926_01890 [Patescibacteria group bacterium]